MLLLLRVCGPVCGTLIATIIAVVVVVVWALFVATVVVVVAAVPAFSWLRMLLLHVCTTVVTLWGLCRWLCAQPLSEQVLRVVLDNVSERSGA